MGITKVSLMKIEKGFSLRQLLPCSFPLDPEGESSDDRRLF